MKKILALLLCGAMLTGLIFTGCGDNSEGSSDATSAVSVNENVADPIEGIEAKASDDKYRNFYQIFVNSFCDSNEDSTGDLQGIISQLDYLNDGDPNTGDDLGIDGIWLTPIMPSKSYHKYDVEDYYDIDEEFGTLEDFDQLVEECHKRGIKLIIDLVLNHSSSEHPFYLKAREEVGNNKFDGYAEYYEIRTPSEFTGGVKFTSMPGGYACEANFSHEMPEWNLNSEKTREEFKNIAKFWLDRGLDGFRLDACKYYNNDKTDGKEFLKWFYETCKEINPDVYVVGETWDDDSVIEGLFESGIDSQFAFKFATSSGSIFESIMTENGYNLSKKVMNYDNKMREVNENQINTLFLSNHDQVRIGNTLEPKGLEYEKFAASVYMLYPGNPFIYYGEEIGLTAENTTNDAAYRGAMVFDTENMPEIFVNGIGDVHEEPTYGGVKQQLADSNSLLNHYRRIIKIKNQNPAIARGKITDLQSFDDNNIAAYYVEYEGEKLMVVHNFNSSTDKEITITDDMIKNAIICADLRVDDASKHIEMKEGKIVLPPQSTVIIKSAE